MRMPNDPGSDEWRARRHGVVRRAFLARAGVFVAAGTFVHGRAAAPRFGVRSPFPGDDLAARARLARSLGYDGIELGPEYLDRSAGAIQAALAGFPVSAIVGSLKLLDPDPAARATGDRARS